MSELKQNDSKIKHQYDKVVFVTESENTKNNLAKDRQRSAHVK